MYKRSLSLMIAMIFIFTAIAGRCGYIAMSKTYQVSDTYNSYTLEIGKLKPYIYDRRGIKLNNNSVSLMAVIRPNEKCMSELDKLFDKNEINEITKELSKGYPIIRKVDKRADTQYIQIFEKIESDTDNQLCRHIIDYQCGGLEYFNNEEIGSLSVNFSVDAFGRVLTGYNTEVIDNNYDSRDGAIISVDSEIQKICEDASKSIEKGAVVVMDTETSQLIASVSMGDDFNNRALSNYAVGSIFKLVVATCAIENNVNPLYNCTSSIKVGDTKFSCQKNHSHGLQNMKNALANSCNCYFVNLALKLGENKLYSTAKKFGFGDSFELYSNWNISGGHFPTLASLESKGQLSLLGFGQGQLTDSPVHFASVVSCIANGGNYHYPTLELLDVEKNAVISEKTAKTLREYMHYVVTDGTGSMANYDNKTSGKTATAQSGIYDNKREILNTWFAGFYPAENPKYTIVVLREDGESGAGDCCPVFRTIVEKLDKM